MSIHGRRRWRTAGPGFPHAPFDEVRGHPGEGLDGHALRCKKSTGKCPVGGLCRKPIRRAGERQKRNAPQCGAFPGDMKDEKSGHPPTFRKCVTRPFATGFRGRDHGWTRSRIGVHVIRIHWNDRSTFGRHQRLHFMVDFAAPVRNQARRAPRRGNIWNRSLFQWLSFHGTPIS